MATVRNFKNRFKNSDDSQFDGFPRQGENAMMQVQEMDPIQKRMREKPFL